MGVGHNVRRSCFQRRRWRKSSGSWWWRRRRCALEFLCARILVLSTSGSGGSASSTARLPVRCLGTRALPGTMEARRAALGQGPTAQGHRSGGGRVAGGHDGAGCQALAGSVGLQKGSGHRANHVRSVATKCWNEAVTQTSRRWRDGRIARHSIWRDTALRANLTGAIGRLRAKVQRSWTSRPWTSS